MAVIRFAIKGETLLMNNIQSANPMFPGAKALKELTGLKKKTDEILCQISDQEFRNAIYYREGIGPYIPGIWLFKCIESGAKKHKLGSKMRQSCIVQETSVPLKYKGPRDIEALVADPYFRLVTAVGVQRAKVMRTRPLFQDWSLEFSVLYDDEDINKNEIITALTDCGKKIGIGDYRPHYGRFEVEILKS